MQLFIDLLLGALSGLWKEILLGLGGLLVAVGLYFKGKKDQKQKDLIRTQKETINATKERQTVEDRVRNASDDERDGLHQPWLRDK